MILQCFYSVFIADLYIVFMTMVKNIYIHLKSTTKTHQKHHFLQSAFQKFCVFKYVKYVIHA